MLLCENEPFLLRTNFITAIHLYDCLMYWFRRKCAEGWAIVFPERLKLAEVRTSLWDLLCDMVTDINTEA